MTGQQRSADYDVVVAGASLAGSAAAILLGRAGLRVMLVEKRSEESAFKRVCSHYIQPSAVATIERLGLLEPMMNAGAVASRVRLRTPWGWIDPPLRSRVPAGLNLRRERLDPLIRGMAAATPGVDLVLGRSVEELVYDGERVCGVRLHERSRDAGTVSARIVLGADGRGSRVAQLAKLRTRKPSHGRFAYGAYFEGPAPAHAPDALLWVPNPDMAAAFPTDSGLVFYAVMPTKRRLAEFRDDPAASLRQAIASLPDAPPILDSRLVGPVSGKIDLTNVISEPVAPGLALIGDASLAIDPLFGVGCGWALQSAEWLAESVSPALHGEESLQRGLRRYRRRRSRALRGHTALLLDSAKARRLNPIERALFYTGATEERSRRVLEQFGARSIGPARMFGGMLPYALLAGARRAVKSPRPAVPSVEQAPEVSS